MKNYIPKSKYKKAKSTDGTEFVEVTSRLLYKGFYIETFAGKFFGGKTPEEDGPELEKIKKTKEFPTALLGLLAGFFKKKPTQSEKEKGVTKRNFIQDRNNNKIIETDPDTYALAKLNLTNSTFAQIDWIIKGPAEDKVFNGYPFEGAESRNRKTIQGLEKQMPGISTFITDYRYLVEQPPLVGQSTSETFSELDQTTQLDNDRKANFDLRK